MNGKRGFKIEEDLPDDESPGYIYDATEQNLYDKDPF